MRLILVVIFLAATGFLFFGMIQPAYTTTKELQAQDAEFDAALARVNELKEVRERLTTKYNSFSPALIDRLFKFLPDTVDQVRLILDVSDIASAHNLQFDDVSVEKREEATGGRGNSVVAEEESDTGYASVSLSFSMTGSYDNFVTFMSDLERSLRLVDVQELTITDSGEEDEDILSFEVAVLTYWLK